MEWKSVVNYKGLYEVSELGDVVSLPRIVPFNVRGKKETCIRDGRELIPVIRNGYKYVSLSKGGKARIFSIHKIVLEAFRCNQPKGLQCRHLDGNKLNCHISNLQWGTAQENIDDRIRHQRERRNGNVTS